MYYSCELLSICIFEILKTTFWRIVSSLIVLWIAFDLYLWNIENNKIIGIMYSNNVVNCFRFVSLKYWKQLQSQAKHILICCELLSICIFEILKTTINGFGNYFGLLWIAFDLYLWNIENNFVLLRQEKIMVVNCFRFVSLKYWKQQFKVVHENKCCCELLSICIFEILKTTSSNPIPFIS